MQFFSKTKITQRIKVLNKMKWKLRKQKEEKYRKNRYKKQNNFIKK